MKKRLPPRTVTVGVGPQVEIRVEVQGEGPTVLCIPSAGRGAADFRYLSQRLADAGFQAIALNPRGVAGSTDPGQDLSLHDMARDAECVAGHFTEAPVDVLGHAFGNRVARCLAADSPEKVRRLVLLAAGGLVPPEAHVASRFGDILRMELSQAERMAALGETFFADGGDPWVWAEGWWPVCAAAQGKAARAPLAEWWAAGAAPVLVLQGLEDRIAPAANARAFVDEFSPRARLVEVPGAGHAMLPEKPAEIAAHVISYLRESW